MRKTTGLLGSALLAAATLTHSAWAGDWLIGAGKYDITGPAADAGMVGYGDVGQTTKGIHSRLWSRAFVMAEPASGKRIVFVSADLQSITQGVKQGVINKLKARYGSTYSDANVMLTATHTHVGPGGYDHYVMLNMSALGYDSLNYNAIVNGIYQSIIEATDSLTPGELHLSKGELLNASVNRNPIPYAKNPDTGDYEYDTNKTMTLLKLVREDGKSIGSIDWFALHNVSFGTGQHQISADHKGAAAQLMEQWAAQRTDGLSSYVAAFANSNLGDISPNICGATNGCGSNDEQSMLLAAAKQFSKAKSLYQQSGAKLDATLDYRHQYINAPGYGISAQYTGNGQQALCEGVVGWSMTAGSTWDGPSNIDGVVEGMTVDNEGSVWNKNQNLFSAVIAGYPVFALMNGFSSLTMFNDTQDDPCQYPKPTFVKRKTLGAELYTPYLPFQMFRIGSLALVAAPGEMTTMAGRRLEAELAPVLANMGIEHVVIAGLANAYQGYITTPEEYAMQHYEGGHTIYGPNTLAAYKQIYSQMSQAMAAGQSVSAGPTPKDLSNNQVINVIGVVYDDKRLWESFGQVWNDAKSSYKMGDKVSVKFRSGHPRNNLLTNSSFIDVQRKVDGNWQTWLTDDSLETKYIWQRDTAADCLACSFATGEWVPGPNTPAGTYRIKHRGHWKSGWDGKIRSYSGTSKSFTVSN
ncbi:neutral/alkaline non-lysosomal ceramidase N-terminal domain-containing protein [Aliiglaciecola sp. CAU 1673]|uniref:neutral/alkaline non-lysosomal ceramidase N-terminal domain-containing protein n=1 Tax=Aliiglaciecola sp. CAU 1673 TaxID=3032595 RepID=UPI0023DCCF01|nr:neutral/alkaline non-lysosomal ceramidase N-terminal domain-containing protein [Aliiglaciecola sp. CAU 1673]MDF2179304.1 neutral/alkaline non-lysosomal ceramidase N-terminal domain-containing protein [Aliiglaciecola sp. CAU 1673]